MSEQPLNPAQKDAPPPASNDVKTIIFMVILSFSCALILSILASVLAKPKEIAKDLDRSEQMMIAAKILSHNGHFLINNKDGKSVPAKYVEDGRLEEGSSQDIATKSQLLDVLNKRIAPLLVDKEGNVKTFQEADINEEQYISSYKKTGYYKQPWMLIYKILPNPQASSSPDLAQTKTPPPAEGYIIPVNGFGLWDAIYGYLAIKPDGNTVIGITWYDQKETPGLGANISDAPWQNLFPGKRIFQESASGKSDVKTAPLGIVVVKGKVSEVLGDGPKAKSAVDGMAGATLTGTGVTDAYREVLSPYRPFLIKLQQAQEKTQPQKGQLNEEEN